MAKREETGELIVKPTRPERRFPWRLWLYAILMTGLAGGAGYVAWMYRAKVLSADDASLKSLITLRAAPERISPLPV